MPFGKSKSDYEGGTTWIVTGLKLQDEKFQKDLGDFDAYSKGLEVGRRAQPHNEARITDEPERSLLTLGDKHRHILAGFASKKLLEALDTIRRRPESLNAEAIIARARAEVRALRQGTKERARPVVMRANKAYGELHYFEAGHGRGPLGEDAYSTGATIRKPMLLAVSAAAIDAIINAVQFVPVMPYGAMQALAIAVGMSGAMALCGAFTGTSLRFWSYRKRTSRWIWRSVGSIAAALGVSSAAVFAQYRAVLEAVARHGGEPELSDILHTSPTIMSVTVFIGAMTVFLFAALKFRGGAGTPWATYGDHAQFDRDVRLAEADLHREKSIHFGHIREIVAAALETFEQQNADDRVMLQEALEACGRAKLAIRDLYKSDQSYFKQVVREIRRFRDGVLAVRPEAQFRELPGFEAEDFPDVTELDRAVSEAEAVFAARTQQLAALEIEIGALEQEMMEGFPALVADINHEAEQQQNDNRSKVRRDPPEPDRKAA